MKNIVLITSCILVSIIIIIYILLTYPGESASNLPIHPPKLTKAESQFMAKCKPAYSSVLEIETSRICWRTPKCKILICIERGR